MFLQQLTFFYCLYDIYQNPLFSLKIYLRNIAYSGDKGDIQK